MPVPPLRRSRHRVALLAVPLLVGVGCTSYRAEPLDPAAELAAFTRRDLTTTSIALPAADQQPGLSEAQLVSIALRLNPGLAITRARQGLAEAALIESGVWPNPEFSLAVRGGSPGVTADLDLLAVLLRPGERGARRSAAEAGQREAQADVAMEEWRVVTAVRLARLDLLAAAALHRAAQDAAELSLRAARALQQRQQLGDATALDVATAGAEAGTAQRHLREAAATLATRERGLNQLLGLPPGLAVPVAGRGEALVPSDAARDIPAQTDQVLLANRWDLRGAHAAYDRREHELRLAIAKQYPALRIGPSASRDGDGTSIGGALALELPIFDRNQGGIRAAQAARDEARARFQAALQQALAETAQAVADVRFAADEVAALDADLMPVSQNALALADQAVQAREMGLIDYLAVRRVWLDAQRARLDAVTAGLRARIVLDQAFGRGPGAQAPPPDATTKPAPSGVQP